MPSAVPSVKPQMYDADRPARVHECTEGTACLLAVIIQKAVVIAVVVVHLQYTDDAQTSWRQDSSSRMHIHTRTQRRVNSECVHTKAACIRCKQRSNAVLRLLLCSLLIGLKKKKKGGARQGAVGTG